MRRAAGLPGCIQRMSRVYKSKHGHWAAPAPPLRRLSDTVSSDLPLRDEPKRDLREAPEAHRKARNLALVRDGFWCRVPGKYDKNTLSEASASSDEI
ncbi:hypothetical protein ARMGADRAFT_1082335 [Armillaria gallica]|uniref:Uncharacterized protein n=1 Tax=Armillaria gallica TaxID=47427 RepID=A0A2H3D7E0_ARMGA|nr:hypothetical protein ARMGADRAFT_1082335 [Armillaria gallica]